MRYVVQPSAVGEATLRVPGDKSISHRALMLSALASGDSRVSGFLPGEDCRATLAALRRLGVSVDEHDDTTLTVHGVGLHGLRAADGPLDLGNSGTGMRLLCGLLAAQSFDTELRGDRSLSGRPMGRVIDPLTAMGARIDSQDGRPPLHVRGKQRLTGIDYPLPVASAQVKSALLLAGLYAAGETAVREPAVTRDHTERMLRAMGAMLATEPGVVRLRPPVELAPVDINVPADLSSATFPMLAAILSRSGRLRISEVGINPSRDGVLRIFRAMGADISLESAGQAGEEPTADIVAGASGLTGIDVDPALAPLAIDEFPALFVAAACATGSTRFSGLEELRVKESDRLGAMAAGLTALGIRVDERPDGMTIEGGRLQGGEVDSHGDHRIAMAFAVAGSVAGGPVRIRDVAPVDTSFPGFVDCLRQAGIDIRTENDA